MQSTDARTKSASYLLQLVPSLITLIRLPMALLFLYDQTSLRTFALILGGLSDFFDGFLARRYNLTSRIGTWLDPILDKFFVFFILAIFWQEGTLSPALLLAFLSRDLAVAAFSLYLLLKGTLKTYKVEAFFWGKVATTLQFLVLLAIIQHIAIPSLVIYAFALIGCLSFRELLRTSYLRLKESNVKE